jgi:phage FluMu gp28-like protein
MYILWYALFHPDQTIAVLANKGATAREMLSRITLALENVPFFLQPGTKALNKGSLEFSNNSRIIAAATSGSSIRGLSVNLLFLDEFAFVDDAATFYTSTYPVVSSGKTSRVIITSTANGIGNIFHKIYEGALQSTNEFKPFRVDWWDVPGRDEEWKKQTISNTSELQFQQEFGNCLKSNSQITICINNSIAEITIGDLYECIRRGSTSGLSIDEEIRLSAIRWYHNRETYEAENGRP